MLSEYRVSLSKCILGQSYDLIDEIGVCTITFDKKDKTKVFKMKRSYNTTQRSSRSQIGLPNLGTEKVWKSSNHTFAKF